MSNVRSSCVPRFDLCLSTYRMSRYCGGAILGSDGLSVIPSANSASYVSYLCFLRYVQHSTFNSQHSTSSSLSSTLTRSLEFRFPYPSHADHSPRLRSLHRKYTRNQRLIIVSPLFGIYTRQVHLSQLHCSTLCMSRSRRMYCWVLSQVSCTLIYIHLFVRSLGQKA